MGGGQALPRSGEDMTRPHASIELGVVVIVGWTVFCLIAAVCGVVFHTSDMHGHCIITTSRGVFGSVSERTVACP